MQIKDSLTGNFGVKLSLNLLNGLHYNLRLSLFVMFLQFEQVKFLLHEDLILFFAFFILNLFCPFLLKSEVSADVQGVRLVQVVRYQKPNENLQEVGKG